MTASARPYRLSRFLAVCREIPSRLNVPVWVWLTAAGLTVALIGLVVLLRPLTWFATEMRTYVHVVSVPVVILLGIGIFAQVRRERLRRDAVPATRHARPRWQMAGIATSVMLLVGMNFSIELAAARLNSHWDQRRLDGVDVLRNHDLSALVGQCVRLAMLKHAEKVTDSAQARALQTLARSAPFHWERLTRGPDPRIAALAEPELLRFVQNRREVALDHDTWFVLLQEWRSMAGRDMPSDDTLDGAARVLAEDFGIALRESLKTDFTKGGRAWAALQLDIAQRLLDRTPWSLSTDDSEIASAFSEIRSLLVDDAASLPELRRVILDVRQAHDTHAREVLRRFETIEAALGRIETQLQTLAMRQVRMHDELRETRTELREVRAFLVQFKHLLPHPGLQLADEDDSGVLERSLRLADAMATAGDAEARQALAAADAGELAPLILFVARLARDARETDPDLFISRSLDAATLAFSSMELGQSADLLYGVLEVNPGHYEAIFWLGLTYQLRGEYALATQVLQRLLDLPLDDDERLAAVWMLGTSALGAQDLATAEATVSAAMGWIGPADPGWALINGLAAQVAAASGDTDTAERLLAQAVVAIADIQQLDPDLYELTLGVLARAASETGNHELAERQYLEQLRLYRMDGDPEQQAWTLETLGRRAMSRQDWAGAERYYREALELWSTLGAHDEVVFMLQELSEVTLARGLPREAEQHLARILEMHVASGDRTEQVHALREMLHLAWDLEDRNELAKAEAVYRNVLQNAEALDHADVQIQALNDLGTLGWLSAERGDLASGASVAWFLLERAALSSDENAGVLALRGAAELFEDLAESAWSLGRMADARRFWDEAVAAYTRAGDPDNGDRVRERREGAR